MSDLVKCLREACERKGGDSSCKCSLNEAADRIEQLERELEVERENNAAELELRLQTQTDLRYARTQLAAEKALADRLAIIAEIAASYAKEWADADGGLDTCDIIFRSDYDAAISSLAAYRKARGCDGFWWNGPSD